MLVSHPRDHEKINRCNETDDSDVNSQLLELAFDINNCYLASREVLYKILDCYIAFRVCHIGKTGMVLVYSIRYITCNIYHVIYISPNVVYIAIYD